ncbi:MAG: MlaD family protein [Candidatus Sumerlaeia bacterium]|nr:MlaD family protein [Candidatus Sumerlaeia bacterium]
MESKQPIPVKRVVLGVLALFVGAWVLGRVLREPEFIVYATMPDAGAISEGADVRVSGFVVGEVKGVDISRDGRGAEAALVLRRQYVDRIFSPPDTYAVIRREQGFFGSKYLEIVNAGAAPIAEGATLRTESNEAVTAVREASAAVKRAGGAVAAQVKDLLPAAADSPRAVGEQAEAIGQTAEAARDELRNGIESVQERLDHIAKSEDGQHYKAMLDSVAKLLEDAAQASGSNAEAAGEILERAAATLERELQTVDREQLAGRLDTAFTELERATFALTRLSHGIVVDLVRGPADGATTGTLVLESP